jgi:Fe-S-cluster containining protein
MVQSHVSYRWTTSQQGKNQFNDPSRVRQRAGRGRVRLPAMKLELSSEQRFTCQQCGMCCRGAWVVVTPAEVERYRKVGAARLYTDGGTVAEALAIDPFEPIAHGHYRIRQRADGACGFLSADNRCRIHEELGGAAKPLACRVFPFRFHPVEGRPLVTTSAACPTIVRNEGAPLAGQAREIAALRAEWARTFPEKDGTLLFTRGRPIEAATLAAIKGTLQRMLDPLPDGAPVDLARGVERMARWLEDLSRHRVARLPPAAFAEYVALTGRHAASAEAPSPAAPSAVTRLLARGFLFTVLAVREQEAASPGIGRHLRRMRHLAHLHGLAPATAAIDRGALRRVPLDAADPEVQRIMARALRASVDGVGTGRRPVIDELAVQSATLAAGIALAAMAAHRAGRERIDAGALVTGITDAAHLEHADAGGLGAILPSLAGGVDALRLVSAWLGQRRVGSVAALV